MAFIPHKHADHFLKTPSASHFLFLIFGENYGLVIERSQMLLRSTVGPGTSFTDLICLAGDVIASDPLKLVDEVHSLNLFDHKPKSILITAGSKSFIRALDMVVRNPPLDRIILIQAGEMRQDSPLRKWFQNQSVAISIECCADEAADLQMLIGSELSAVCTTLDQEACEVLISLLGEDRLLSRFEIEKLLLYAKDMKSITTAEIYAICADTTAINVQTLVPEVFSGELVRALQHSNKLILGFSDKSRLLVTTLRYALALHRARVDIEAGNQFDAALRYFVHQVNSYLRKDSASAQLRSYTPDQIVRLIFVIYGVVIETRETSYLDDKLTSYLIFFMTRLLDPMFVR